MAWLSKWPNSSSLIFVNACRSDRPQSGTYRLQVRFLFQSYFWEKVYSWKQPRPKLEFSDKLPTWEFSWEHYFPIWLHFEILPLPSGTVCTLLLFSLLPSFLPSSHFQAQPCDSPGWRRSRGAQQKRGDPGRWTAPSKVRPDRTISGRGNNRGTTRRGKIGGWVKQRDIQTKGVWDQTHPFIKITSLLKQILRICISNIHMLYVYIIYKCTIWNITSKELLTNY